MDQYIRDFNFPSIDTYCLTDLGQCNQLFEINKHNDNFTIFHNNIRSISKNLDELKVSLSDVLGFDCIVLTETWRIIDMNLYNIAGYNLIYNEGESK